MKFLLIVPLVLGIVIGLFALTGLFWMFIWNAIIPSVFDGPSLSYLQTLGLLLLLSLVGGTFRTVVSS